MAAAQRYAEKCIQLRGDWCFFEPMAQVMLYCHMEHQHQQHFTEAWSLFEREAEKGEHKEVDDLPNAKDVKPSQQKQQGKQASKTQSKPIEATDAKKLTIELNKAYKLKHRWQKATSQAASLLKMIEAGGPWGWADNRSNRGKLTEKVTALQGAVNEFSSQLLVTEMKDLRARYGTEYLFVHLQEWLSLESLLADVEKECVRLVKMHRVSSS